MQNVRDIQQNYLNKTLEKRRQMAASVENAIRVAPVEMSELLQAIGNAYACAKIPLFWNVLAHLSGSDRGFGNGAYFDALETQKRVLQEAKEEQK